jgi:thiamine pyrophosphokinase
VLHGPGRLRFEEPAGTTISLIALHGRCKGVTVSGVRWPLGDARLPPVAGLGISNVATGEVIEIVVMEGVVTVIANPAATNPAGERV